VGKVYNQKQCSRCEHFGKVIESWGVYYCKKCYADKPKKTNGNGGMVFKGININHHIELPFDDGITLERCRKSHPVFCDLYLTHYPDSKGIMGRSFNYIVRIGGEVAGIIGANSPPLNYKLFRAFFQSDDEKEFLNNNVFRMIRHESNLATKVLKIFRLRIKNDYMSAYGVKLKGICTFVEPPRNGAVYRADNWEYLGDTQGKTVKKRDMGTWTNKEWGEGNKKLIFAIRYR
jgi:hypothetical protein